MNKTCDNSAIGSRPRRSTRLSCQSPIEEHQEMAAVDTMVAVDAVDSVTGVQAPTQGSGFVIDSSFAIGSGSASHSSFAIDSSCNLNQFPAMPELDQTLNPEFLFKTAEEAVDEALKSDDQDLSPSPKLKKCKTNRYGKGGDNRMTRAYNDMIADPKLKPKAAILRHFNYPKLPEGHKISHKKYFDDEKKSLQSCCDNLIRRFKYAEEKREKQKILLELQGGEIEEEVEEVEESRLVALENELKVTKELLEETRNELKAIREFVETRLGN